MAPAIEAPLLREDGLKRKPASVTGAVFNISTSIIGAGIMSIPATFKILGVIPAFVLIVLIAVLASVSSEFILKFTYCGELRTYAGIMKEAFGYTGFILVQLGVMITNLGCLIMYLIIIGDVLSGKGTDHLGILQEVFGLQWWTLRPVTLLFMAVVILLPLVLLRRVDSLWISSALSVLLAVVFVGICSALAIVAVFRGEAKPLRYLPLLENGASFFDLFTAIPVIVTAYTFHFNVHAIATEMETPKGMNFAVRIALLICAIIYFSIGIFGYLLFGDSTMDDILVNFDRTSGSGVTSILNDLVRLSYAIHLVLVFPLLNFSLRSNIDELLFRHKPPLETDTKRFVFLTLALLAVAYILAIAIPSIWYLFQFMGSTSAVSLAFIFPGALALRDVHGISTLKDKVIGASMVGVALLTSLIAISTNAYKIFAA